MTRLQVPSHQYPFIQTALNAITQWRIPAEIAVAPGVHRGDLVIFGDVTIVPAAGPGTVTIEAAGHTAVTCNGRAVISGMAITGAVYANYADLTVAQCEIRASGAGVAAVSSTVALTDTRVVGGGVVLLQRSSARLVRCGIRNAEVAVLLKDSHAVLQHSTVDDCDAGVVADEGALLTMESTKVAGIRMKAVTVRQKSQGRVTGCEIARVDVGIEAGDKAQLHVGDTAVADCGTGIQVHDDAAAELTSVRVARARGVGVFLSSTAPATVHQLAVREAFMGLHVRSGHATLCGIEVEQVTDTGIALNSGSVTTLRAATVRDAATGIDVLGLLTSCEGRGLTATACAVGVQVREGARLTWANGVAEQCVEAGLQVRDRSEVTVTSVRVTSPRHDGITVDDSSRAVLQDTVVTGAGGAGMRVSDRSRATVDRCELTGNTGSPLVCDATSTVNGSNADDVTMTDVKPGAADAEPGGPAPGSTAKVTAPTGRSRAELMAELDGLVGLAQVKAQVERQIRSVEVELRRKASGLKVSPTSRHLVFAGPPGTGKTTVARLYAELLAGLKAVRRGQLVEVSRSDLVEQWVGWSARSTKAIVEKALGGVLFIDEAYSLAGLAGGSGHDFGREVIDELVLQMENHREDLVVIVAGYADEMQTFIASNPGLATRFSRTITFPNYAPDEVVEILRRMARHHDYVLTEAAAAALTAFVTQRPEDRNGRAARNLFDRLREHQEARIGADPSLEAMQNITEEDVEALLTTEA